jgi:hypothetical protein
MSEITSTTSVKPSNTAVLLKFQFSWAGEIDIYGLMVVSENYWQMRRAEILGFKSPIYLCVGTNEDLQFESGAEVIEAIAVSELSPTLVAHYRSEYPVKHYNRDLRFEPNVLAAFGERGFLDNLADTPSTL